MTWKNNNLFPPIFLLVFFPFINHFFSVFFSSASFSSFYTFSSFFFTSFSFHSCSFFFIFHSIFHRPVPFLLTTILPLIIFLLLFICLPLLIFPRLLLSLHIPDPHTSIWSLKNNRWRCGTWLQGLDTHWPYIFPRRRPQAIRNEQQADINTRQREQQIR